MPALPAINSLRTLLSSAVSIGATTISVASTAGWPTSGILSIDDEVIEYTGIVGNSFTGCVRGYDGTTPASHSTLDPLGNPNRVSLRIIAKHLNDAAYENATATPRRVGGIPAGSVFSQKTTVQEVVDQLLHPASDFWTDTPLHVTFATANNAVIATLAGTYTIVGIELRVTQAFDGVPPTIAIVGDDGMTTTTLMAAGDSELDTVMDFVKSMEYAPGVPFTLKVQWGSFSPAPTQGAITIILKVVEN